MLTRRATFAALTLAFAAGSAAQAAESQILLWPNGAPGAGRMKLEQSPAGSSAVTGVLRPSITLYRPAGPFTKAVLVVPGGGFRQVVFGKEGADIAKWLTSNGIAAGVLTYRLPNDKWPQGPRIMLEDAQRALRLLRQQTGAAQVGILGFSAGGTIAEILDSRADEEAYTPIDSADVLSAKPDFVGLGYAFLNVPRSRVDNGLRGFPKRPAPTFIFHAADDSRVSVENSRAAYKAITKAGGKAEIHVFETGGHGFALLSPPGSPSAAWPKLFLAWLNTL